MNKYIYYFLCFAILIISCRPDEFTETIVEQTPVEEDAYNSGEVAGLIMDEQGAALEGVELFLEGESTFSDANGYFSFKAIDLSEGGSLLKITKEDYFENYKFVYGQEGTQSYINVTMIEAIETGRFAASTGATIGDQSGATITFPENTFAKDGLVYDGEVTVKSHWYNPDDALLSSSMPGDLRGINNNNESVVLATLGMMAVDIYAADGSRLQIAEGKTATLTFPISSQMASEVSDEVPLWSLNESTGVWDEEGVAFLVGNTMVGEVSHFSFWNCDVPFPTVFLEGTLLSNTGDALVNWPVKVRVSSSAMVAYSTTNSEGTFSGKVPMDAPLELSVTHCGVDVLDIDLGVISSDTDLGDITVNFADFEKAISGRLVDCMGMPLVDAYVIVVNGNAADLLVPDADGFFDGYVVGCGNEVTISAINPMANLETEPIILEANNDPLNIGEWSVCVEQTERIIYSINGGQNNLFTEARISLIDNELIHIYAADLFSGVLFDTQVALSEIGTAAPLFTSIAGLDDNSQSASAVCGNYARNSGIVCPDLEITITSFGSVGDWLMGTISGTMETATQAPFEIEGSFQLIIDEAFETGRVEGKVWNDANGDGIQDQGEEPVSGILIGLGGVPINTSVRRIYPFDSQTNVTKDDGNYYYDGLVPGEDYTLFWKSSQLEYTVSPGNQGDDMTDSDFELQNGSFENYIIELMNFTGSGLESNVDLGLIKNELMCNIETGGCGSDAYIEVNPTGGIPPYTITLDGMTTLPSGQNIFEGVSSGVHSVTVEDVNGAMCIIFENVETAMNQIHVQVWQDMPGGIPDVFDELSANPNASWAVTLTLYKDGIVHATTTTDLRGEGVFDSLIPGNYEVTMVVPNGFEFVLMSVGNDEDKDSDMDPTTGFTDGVSYTSDCDGEARLTIGIREL